MEKAILHSFGNSKHFLCSLHMKNNVLRFLSDHGIGVKERGNFVYGGLFGKNGIATAKSETEFIQKKLELYSKYHELFEETKIAKYLELILEKINEKVRMPKSKIRQDSLPSDFYTNNSAESMNHIFKLKSKWKVMKLPDLCKLVSGVYDLQRLQIEGAFIQKGMAISW